VSRPVPTSETSHSPSASWGRRFLALLVDWFACLAVAQVLVAYGVLDDNANGTWTLALFVLESAFFTALLGGSFGKLVTRLRVVRADGSAGPVGLIGALLRSVLVALVIPPLVYRPDGRGLHDLAARTRTVAL
jgi:uncharacterized RDD family membrane protein YckC